MHGRSHATQPLPRKFRAPVADGIASFLEAWRGARLKPYWRSAPLASADRFAWLDGEALKRERKRAGAIVLFVSGGDQIAACAEALQMWAGAAKKVRASRGAHAVARLFALNQSENEHDESIPDTPWIRYWPVDGGAVDVYERKADRLVTYLEDFTDL
jgi:hypothetical protein